MPEKLYRINMNVDITEVHKPLLTNRDKPIKEEGKETAIALKFENYTAPEYFKSICMQAISQAHPTGSMASLRRTKSIGDKMAEASETGGYLDLIESDYKYIESAINKADKWNNEYNIAKSVIIVVDAITNADVVE